MQAISDRQLLEDLARTVKTIAQNQIDFGQELVGFKTELEALKGRVDRMSDRSRAPSQHDLDAQRQLAAEMEARQALTEKVESLEAAMRAALPTLETLKKAVVTWWSTPTGMVTSKLIYVLLAAAWLWASTHLVPGK